MQKDIVPQTNVEKLFSTILILIASGNFYKKKISTILILIKIYRIIWLHNQFNRNNFLINV